MNDVEIQAYPIQRCGKGRALGQECNRKASHVHVRADASPPLVLWMCKKCHAESVQESHALRHARKLGSA